MVLPVGVLGPAEALLRVVGVLEALHAQLLRVCVSCGSCYVGLVANIHNNNNNSNRGSSITAVVVVVVVIVLRCRCTMVLVCVIVVVIHYVSLNYRTSQRLRLQRFYTRGLF